MNFRKLGVIPTLFILIFLTFTFQIKRQKVKKTFLIKFEKVKLGKMHGGTLVSVKQSWNHSKFYLFSLRFYDFRGNQSPLVGAFKMASVLHDPKTKGSTKTRESLEKRINFICCTLLNLSCTYIYHNTTQTENTQPRCLSSPNNVQNHNST